MWFVLRKYDNDGFETVAWLDVDLVFFPVNNNATPDGSIFVLAIDSEANNIERLDTCECIENAIERF